VPQRREGLVVVEHIGQAAGGKQEDPIDRDVNKDHYREQASFFPDPSWTHGLRSTDAVLPLFA
jgi:hypothetical protein